MRIPEQITKSFAKTSQSADIAGCEGDHPDLLRCRLNYLQAAELARLGHYSEAELLLLEAGKEEVLKPAVLDLRAKMFAQQGRFAEAEKCWIEALSLDPGNPEYRRALDMLTRPISHSLWTGPVKAAIIVAVTVAALSAIFIVGLRWSAGRYDSLNQQIVKTEQKLSDLNNRLHQRVVESEKNLFSRNDTLHQRIAESEEMLLGKSNVLQRQIIEIEQELLTSVSSLSGKVELLEEKNAQLQKTIDNQLASYDSLQQRIAESQKTLLVYINGLSQSVDSLEEESTQLQKTFEDWSTSDDNWIAGLGKILFAPVDLILKR